MMTDHMDELYDRLADDLDRAGTLVPAVEQHIGDVTEWEQVLGELDRLAGLVEGAKSAAQRLAELHHDDPAR